jgi:hypothetical protein
MQEKITESSYPPRLTTEKGYYGVPFDDIPDGLRELVQTAAKTAKSGGQFTLNFIEQEAPEGQQPTWRYGEYTDVYEINDLGLQASYHRAGNKLFRTFLTGGGDPRQIDAITASLGFDRGRAVVIDNPLRGDKPRVQQSERPTTPSGLYGQKREPTPTK